MPECFQGKNSDWGKKLFRSTWWVKIGMLNFMGSHQPSLSLPFSLFIYHVHDIYTFLCIHHAYDVHVYMFKLEWTMENDRKSLIEKENKIRLDLEEGNSIMWGRKLLLMWFVKLLKKEKKLTWQKIKYVLYSKTQAFKLFWNWAGICRSGDVKSMC